MQRWLLAVLLLISSVVVGCGGVVDEAEVSDPSFDTVRQELTPCLSTCFFDCGLEDLDCRDDCRTDCSRCEQVVCHDVCSSNSQACNRCVNVCMGWW
ncbi:hypothetical protein ACN47A_03970 [Myxococcus fulvus]|uniref:hypothetical protein n=1 Tax=Myxococcus fulvus TaxID=33 RepID=UPI003B9C95D2